MPSPRYWATWPWRPSISLAATSWYARTRSRRSSGSRRCDNAVESAMSQNRTVTWRRSAARDGDPDPSPVAWGSGSGAPQSAQNLLPGIASAPHAGQRATLPVMGPDACPSGPPSSCLRSRSSDQHGSRHDLRLLGHDDLEGHPRSLEDVMTELEVDLEASERVAADELLEVLLVALDIGRPVVDRPDVLEQRHGLDPSQVEAGVPDQGQLLGKGAVVPGRTVELVDERHRPRHPGVPLVGEVQLLVEHETARPEQAVDLREIVAEVMEVDDHLVRVDRVERAGIVIVLPVGLDDRDVGAVPRHPLVRGQLLERRQRQADAFDAIGLAEIDQRPAPAAPDVQDAHPG